MFAFFWFFLHSFSWTASESTSLRFLFRLDVGRTWRFPSLLSDLSLLELYLVIPQALIFWMIQNCQNNRTAKKRLFIVRQTWRRRTFSKVITSLTRLSEVRQEESFEASVSLALLAYYCVNSVSLLFLSCKNAEGWNGRSYLRYLIYLSFGYVIRALVSLITVSM